jgi:hypothetical protein
MSGTQEVAMVLRKNNPMTEAGTRLMSLPLFPVTALSGAEGDGDGGGEPKPKPEPAPSPTAKTFSEEYVKQLREEAIKAKADAKSELETFHSEFEEVKAALAKFTEGEKTAIEKAESAVTESTEKLTSAQTKLRAAYLENALLAAGTVLEFHDPLDAATHLDMEALTFDEDGKPDEKQVMEQLKKVAEAKTYLVKTVVVGDGDGGAGGAPVATDEQKALRAKYDEDMKNQGRIPIPT